MGTAHVTSTKERWDDLVWKYHDQVEVLAHTDWGDGTFLLLVKSGALPDGVNGEQELWIEDGIVKFRRWYDT